jgi:hypothetical protein
VFAIKPIEYSIQAYSGVGTFITVPLAELIPNPLCYGETLTTPLFHKKLLDAPLGLLEIFGFVSDMQHVLYTLPYPTHPSPQISETQVRSTQSTDAASTADYVH